MIRAESLFAAKEDTLSRPVEHLMACHRRIEERLETLERVAEHGAARPEEAKAALANALHFMDTSGVLHTADEEESLFPRLMPKLERGEKSFVAGLEHDHTEAHRLYTELKQLAADPVFDARFASVVDRLAALYRAHIAKEDEILTAMAREKLTEQELSEVSREMVARRRSADPIPDSSR